MTRKTTLLWLLILLLAFLVPPLAAQDDCFIDEFGDEWCLVEAGDTWADDLYEEDCFFDEEDNEWCWVGSADEYYEDDCFFDDDGTEWCLVYPDETWADGLGDEDCFIDEFGDRWCDWNAFDYDDYGDYDEEDCWIDEYGDEWCWVDEWDESYFDEEDCWIDEFGDEWCYVDDSEWDEAWDDWDDVDGDWEGDFNEDVGDYTFYEVNNGVISNQSGTLIGTADQHAALWAFVTALIPADQLNRYVTGYEVFTDPDTMAYVYPDEMNPGQWIIGISIDLLRPDGSPDPELRATIVHEFAHILTLNQSQMDINVSEATCSTYYDEEGCALGSSYIAAFYAQFWQDDPDALPDSHFVSDYARTNIAEDMAESFAFFVMNGRPTGSTVADQKVLFFWNYPELVQLRSAIRQGL